MGIANPSCDLAGRHNLGRTIAARLEGVGISSFAALAEAGSVAVYRRLCEQAGRRLPVCYYLYSLEGALRGVHWNELPAPTKARLMAEAGLGRKHR